MKSILLTIAFMLGITSLAMGSVVITSAGSAVTAVTISNGQPAVNLKLTQSVAGAATIKFPTLAGVKFDPTTVSFTADGGSNQVKDVAMSATSDADQVIIATTWLFTVTGAADNTPATFAITIIAPSSLADIPVTFVTGGAAVTSVELYYNQAPVKIKFTMAVAATVFYTFPTLENVKFNPTVVDFAASGGANQEKTVEITSKADVASTISASSWHFIKSGSGSSGYKVPVSFAITILALEKVPITFVTGGAAVTDVKVTYGEPAVNIRFTKATAGAATIKFPTLLYVKFDPAIVTFTADDGNNKVIDVAVSSTQNVGLVQKGWKFITTGRVTATPFSLTSALAVVPKPKTPTVVPSQPEPKPADNSSVMTIVPNFIVLCAVIIIFAM